MARGGKKAKKGGSHNRVGTTISKQACSSSEQECIHVTKAVKLNALQKILPHAKAGQCRVCGKGQSPRRDDSKGGESTIKDVCICLRCGQQGCSRQCKQQHSYQHYMTTQSHCVVLNLLTWMVWCYECDRELTVLSDNSQLSKTLKYIRTWISKECVASAEPEPEPVSAAEKDTNTHPKGLKNLGNTCFFNSVLQNLAQTQVLRRAMDKAFQEERQLELQGEDDDQEVLKVNISSLPGALTEALKHLLDDFSRCSQKVMTPGRLFNEISKKAPQFRGFQQHDSQELLRYLLDGMKTEEMKRIEKGIKESLEAKEESSKSEKKNPKAYLKNAKTFIDDIFGGQLVSTVLCHQCKHMSHTYDGFLDLSLPVSDSEKSRTVKNMAKFRREVKSSNSETQEEKTEPNPVLLKKLSKHQRKMQVRQERKARRSKDKLSNRSNDSEEIVDEEMDPFNDAMISTGAESLAGEEAEANDSTAELCNTEAEGSVEELPQTMQAERGTELLGDNVAQDKEESLDVGDQRTANVRLSSSDLTEDEEMDPEDQKRLSEVTMDLLQRMARSCSFDICPIEDTGESDEELNNDEPFERVKDELGDAHCEEMEVSRPELDDGTCVIDEQSFPLRDSIRSLKSEDADKLIEDLTRINNNENTDDLIQDANILRNSLHGESLQTVGVTSHTTDSVCGDELCNRNSYSSDQEQPVTQSVEEAPGQTLQTSNESMDPAPMQPDTSKLEASDPCHPSDEATNKDSPMDDPIVEQLRNAVQSVTLDDDKKGDTRIGAIGTDNNVKYESDSGFSSIGEIYSEVTQEGEDANSGIEDFSHLQFPGSSILECLKFFCSVDILDGKNKFACENCYKLAEEKSLDQSAERQSKESRKTVLSEASKQLLIAKPPKVLTLHLKRFEQTGRQLRKICRPIEFPLLLDISPFCHRKSKVALWETKYKLYGLVEHSGSLSGGHYVSYVYNSQSKSWFYISDTRVSVVSEDVVLRKQAYLLFYQQGSENRHQTESGDGEDSVWVKQGR